MVLINERGTRYFFWKPDSASQYSWGKCTPPNVNMSHCSEKQNTIVLFPTPEISDPALQ